MYRINVVEENIGCKRTYKILLFVKCIEMKRTYQTENCIEMNDTE